MEFIATRFLPINVTGIGGAAIIGATNFQSEEVVSLGTIFRTARQLPKASLLASADVQLTVSLEHAIPPEHLAVYLDRKVALHAEEICIRIGMVSQETTFDLPKQTTNYLITFPLVVAENLGKIPLSDWVHTQNQSLIHYTVNFPGIQTNGSPCTFKLRAKVNREHSNVEITSISSTLVDIARVKESSKNAVTFTGEIISAAVSLLKKLTKKQGPQPASSPMETPNQPEVVPETSSNTTL